MQISIGIDESGKPRVVFEGEAPIKRPEKGNSVLGFPDAYTIIDVETTGLDVRYCEIIEISAIKYRDGAEAAVFNSLVKLSEEIDDFITSLTGITNEMLSGAPDIRAVLPDFYKFVSGETLVGYLILQGCFMKLRHKRRGTFLCPVQFSAPEFHSPMHKKAQNIPKTYLRFFENHVFFSYLQ